MIELVRKNALFFILPLFSFPILPSGAQSLTLIFCIGILIIAFRKNYQPNLKKIGYTPFLLLISWVVLMFVTIFFSESRAHGINYIVRCLSLLAAPWLFLYFSPSFSSRQKSRINVFFVFIYGFLTVFLISKILVNIDALGFIDSSGSRTKGLLSMELWEQFKIVREMPLPLLRYYLDESNINTPFVHKAYVSMGYVWCIFLIVDGLLRKKHPFWIKSISFITVVIFVLAVFFFTSIPNILVLICLPIFFSFQLYRKIKKGKKKTIFAVIIVGIALSLPFINTAIKTNDRLNVGFKKSTNLLSDLFNGEINQGSNVRIFVWNCAMEKIAKRPFVGYGIGSESKILEGCYKDKGCKACFDEGFNAHNQFFSVMLNGGLLLLTGFLISFGYLLKTALKAKHAAYLFFLFLLLINFMGESVLVRIHGILFFSLFNSMLLSEVLKKPTLA